MSENLSVEEIAAQFLERRDAGETLDTEEFIAAYPEYADELRDLLGLMAISSTERFSLMGGTP